MAIQFESSIKVTGTIDLNDGNGSTIIGTSAGGGGTNITAVGYEALASNTGNYACGFGSNTLALNTGNYSNGFGGNALAYNTGDNSNGFGHSALNLNTGANASGFGSNALLENTGANACGFGYNALYNNTGDSSNGFGYAALYNNIGIESNGFGYSALAANTGNYACGFGYEALQTNTGFASNGFGLWALRYNTGGNSNGFGNQALGNNTGDNTNAFGALALFWNSGEKNTAIGDLAARGDEGFKLTGSNNTFLGANASYGTNTTISNSTAVGANVTLTDSNTVILGNGASVGIGTTSPQVKLHLHDGDSTSLKLTNTSSGTGAFDGLSLAVGDLGGLSGKFGQLWYYENGFFRIATNNIERMRIDASGNVGIGTTSPTNGKLEIQSSTNQISVNTGTAGDGRLHIGHFSNGTFISTYGNDGGSADVIRFGTHSGDERMRIDQSGNVGIGTTSPDGKLHIDGISNFVSGLVLGASNIYGDNRSIDFQNTSGALRLGLEYDNLNTNLDIVDRSRNKLVTFRESGNVGIGTNSPNYKLDVDDTIGVKDSLIVNHVPGTFPRVFPIVTPGGFFETEPTGRVGVVNNQGSGEWAFSAVSVADGANFTNRSGLLHSNVNAYRLVLANTTEENIRLNSDGNSFLKGRVAIGHDTPTEALDVDGIVKVSDRVKTNQISVNGGSEIKLNQATFYNTSNICNKEYTDIGATLHLRTDEPLTNQSVIALTKGGQGTDFPSGITQNSNGDYTFLLRDRNNNQRIRFVANDLSSGDSIIDSRRMVLLGNAFGQNGSISIDGRKASNGVSNAVMKFNKSGTQADTALEFWIGVNLRGSISYSDTGTAYNVASDYRLKENVVEITDGIERLKQLKPSRFNFISNTEKVVDGFIAHEVESVIPEAVTGEKDATEEYEVTPAEYDDYGNLVSEAVMGTRDAYQQIDQAKIVPLLTAALQEAVAKIESLEARIQALESN